VEGRETSFFRVNVWRQQAENVAETLTKGTRAIVTGKLRNRAWQTDGGEQRTVTEIEADEIGPSLTWTTAEVECANRAGAGDKGGQFNDEPRF
jgi:single-strand DNA-binding protein